MATLRAGADTPPTPLEPTCRTSPWISQVAKSLKKLVFLEKPRFFKKIKLLQGFPYLGCSWGLCGRSWATLGPLWAVLSRSWGLWGRSWDALGASVGGPGPLLGRM